MVACRPSAARRTSVIGAALEAAIPWPEAPVLMDHQADAPVNPPGQRVRLGEGRGQRLLAEHRDRPGSGDVDQRGMGFARRGDIEGIDRLGREQAFEPVKGGSDAELAGALPRPIDIRIADRHHHGAALARPGDEMVVTDHPGPHHGDPQRCLEAGSPGSHHHGSPTEKARRIVPQHLRPVLRVRQPPGEGIAQCAVAGPLVDRQERPVGAP